MRRWMRSLGMTAAMIAARRPIRRVSDAIPILVRQRAASLSQRVYHQAARAGVAVLTRVACPHHRVVRRAAQTTPHQRDTDAWS